MDPVSIATTAAATAGIFGKAKSFLSDVWDGIAGLFGGGSKKGVHRKEQEAIDKIRDLATYYQYIREAAAECRRESDGKFRLACAEEVIARGAASREEMIEAMGGEIDPFLDGGFELKRGLDGKLYVAIAKRKARVLHVVIVIVVLGVAIYVWRRRSREPARNKKRN